MINLSLENFDSPTRLWLSNALCQLGTVKVLLGSLLCFVAYPLGIVFGLAGAMTWGIAGVVRLTPTQLKFSRDATRLKIFKTKGFQIRRVRTTIRNRSRRTITRPAFASGGSDNDDGDSNSDPDESYDDTSELNDCNKQNSAYFITPNQDNCLFVSLHSPLKSWRCYCCCMPIRFARNEVAYMIASKSTSNQLHSQDEVTPTLMLLSEKQTAQYLAVSKSNLRISRYDDILMYVIPQLLHLKLGGRVFYKRVECDQWLTRLPAKQLGVAK